MSQTASQNTATVVWVAQLTIVGNVYQLIVYEQLAGWGWQEDLLPYLHSWGIFGRPAPAIVNAFIRSFRFEFHLE